MTLNGLVKNLQDLIDNGHGDKQVFTTHGASGCCCEVGHAYISDHVGDSGPFDLAPGEEYVNIYNGN